MNLHNEFAFSSDSASPQRLLLVDDDVLVRQCLGEMLEALGWHVTKETNGRTALARFLVEGFDVVLTDHRMPVAGGTMLVEGLRRAGFAGRIVVLSGSLTKLERQHYSALGVDGFGEKPISLDALEALLGGRPQALSGAVNM